MSGEGDAAVAAAYATRAQARRVEQAFLERRTQRFGAGRLFAFAAAALFTVLATRSTAGRAADIAWGLAALFWAAFVALVVAGTRVSARARRAGALAALNEQGVHRVRREWSAIAEPSWPSLPPEHAFAGDLDVVGQASLSRLFPPLSAAPGRSTLALWLLGARSDGIVERQRAVADLAPRVELRDEFALLASRSRGDQVAFDRLRATLEGSGSSAERKEPDPSRVRGALPVPTASPVPTALPPSARVLAFVLPILTIALAAAEFRGIFSGPWWLIPIACGLLVTRRNAGILRPSLDAVTEQARAIRHFAAMAHLIGAERFDAPWLVATAGRLRDDDAATALDGLARIGDWAETRHSPLFHAVLHAVTLWDFHLTARIERWRAAFAPHVGDWLDSIGDIEAMSALATLAHDNPDWTVPSEPSAAAPAELRATQLGHPLLPADARVCNDVVVGPPGTLLLVTGSNMAGKSTLLRAMGLNVVLAQAGGPVCARAFSCPSVRLYTSIRVQDSLERGVSYFMAELQRLKLIVDAAARGDASTPVLYLLDEMLHGTNSVERAIAARRVLAQLLASGGIGAVTTHDLSLADGPPLAAAARQVHFREHFSREGGQPRMSFDYVLRPGPADSTNALKLLELVGLDG